MTRKHVISLLAAGATLVASPYAQAEQSNSGPTIVVTGRLPPTEAKTLEVVRRVARPVDGQLARFKEPVCPRVTGFQSQYEALVAKRIRAVAEAVGAGAGEEGCVTNLYVVVVDHGGEFVAELHRRDPEALAGLSKREFAALTTDQGAARSWTTTALTNSVGAIAARPPPTVGGGAVRYERASMHFGDVDVLRVYESSNISPSVRQAIVSAWVVLETRATFGKSLAQLADYAALRGLAMVRPAELDGSEDTILALFKPGSDAAPAELTEFDRAYLKSLYHVQGRGWAGQQVRQMADSIARENGQAAP
ncbi:MAG: hypothetical protein ABI769_17265 [Pseudomonadota bacterium]